MESDLLAPQEAAELLDVSLSTVWRLIRSGELPSVTKPPKPGLRPRIRVERAALESFIKEATNA